MNGKSSPIRMEGGLLLKINTRVQVRYLGESNPLSLLNGKVYPARILQLGWYGIVDETNEEYAYPPERFELVEVCDPGSYTENQLPER